VHLSFHQAIHLQIPQMVLKRMRLNQRWGIIIPSC
jgi:hypothetical protein